MADERVVPEDLKALYNAAEVARDYADSRAQANQVLGLIERIADSYRRSWRSLNH